MHILWTKKKKVSEPMQNTLLGESQAGGRWFFVCLSFFLAMSKITSENWTMYQSAEFITEVISETESLDTSDPESPLMLPWKSYKNHFRW